MKVFTSLFTENSTNNYNSESRPNFQHKLQIVTDFNLSFLLSRFADRSLELLCIQTRQAHEVENTYSKSEKVLVLSKTRNSSTTAGKIAFVRPYFFVRYMYVCVTIINTRFFRDAFILKSLQIVIASFTYL